MKHIYHSSEVNPDDILPRYFKHLVESKSGHLKEDLDKEVRKHFRRIYNRTLGKNWEELSKKFPGAFIDHPRTLSSPKNWYNGDFSHALFSQFWAVIELPSEFPNVNFYLEFPDKNKKIMEILEKINKIKYEVLEEFRKRKFLGTSEEYFKLPGIVTVGDLKNKYPDIYNLIYHEENQKEVTIEEEVKFLRSIMYEV